MDEDCGATPSATGILHCLKLLAQEAASLNLIRTLSAIKDALETAACESGMETQGDGHGNGPTRSLLH
jgi:hypothetical protein